MKIRGTGLPPDTEIVNGGTVGFKSKTLNQPGSELTNEVTTTVLLPDLALQKTHTGDFEAGGSATYKIAVSNVGKAPTQGPTVVTDQLPPKVTLDGTPSGTGWTCTPTTGGFRCERPDSLAPGASFPTISAPVNIAEDAAPQHADQHRDGHDCRATPTRSTTPTPTRARSSGPTSRSRRSPRRPRCSRRTRSAT